ncbi:MAG: MMPL family transporter [bacterium]
MLRDRVIAAIEGFVFIHRRFVLAFFAAFTLLMAYYATHLRIDAGFEKLLPYDHPYIETFKQYRSDFGGADRILVAVRATEGDMFTPEFFKILKGVTDEVFFLPGVDRSRVQSIFTPNVRFIEIVEGGFSGGNVMPAEFQPTPEGMAEVRENILKAGIVGRLVANDFTAAMVSAQLAEIDPATGERLNYIDFAHKLEEKARKPFENERFEIHIIGFAKMIGDIADGAAGVVAFFGVAALITYLLVFFFTHSQRVTLLAILCSAIGVLWDLGLLMMLGFGIDPMSILVPFLVFAIGCSHAVQMSNAYSAELQLGADNVSAARAAFRRLVIPGTVALVTDSVGFLTISFIKIRMIQELAIVAGLGVMLLLFTNLFLLPVLLSYLRLGDAYRARMIRWSEFRERLWKPLSAVAERKWAPVILGVAVLLFAFGLYEAKRLQIGDIQAGVPELRPDARYNRDAYVITSKFSIGVDILSTIVETGPDGCIEHDVMAEMDRFDWRVANVPGVQSTISMPQVAKRISSGWNEGSLKWRTLPRSSINMVQAVRPIIENPTGLMNRDCSAMPVLAFAEDHKAETIQRIVDAVKEFSNGAEKNKYRLASGNLGVMAATNEEVKRTQFPILFWVWLVTVTLCLISFRSLRVTLCIIIPLGAVSILCNGLMSLLGIGLKVNTLPVAALGVGIGVDYGVYIFGRMQGLLAQGKGLREAYHETLRVTGAAVLVTGLTLAIGVATWVFSALKFQADMGLLLSFVFLANMLGALFVLPALASLFFPAGSKSGTRASAAKQSYGS